MPVKKRKSGIVAKVREYPIVLGSIVTAVVLVAGYFGGVLVFGANLVQSDPPPYPNRTAVEKMVAGFAPVTRVAQLERALVQSIQATNAATKALDAHTQQLDRRNDDSATSWCEHYRQNEAADRVLLAKKPDDALLLKESLFDADQRAHWCGQVTK